MYVCMDNEFIREERIKEDSILGYRSSILLCLLMTEAYEEYIEEDRKYILSESIETYKQFYDLNL